MEQKVQELTKKIYEEGVQQGEARARELVEEAQKRAGTVVADARTEAERIVADARKQAEEMKRTAESEIKIAGQQALSSLKQQIAQLIDAKIVNEPAAEVLSEPAVIKELLTTIVNSWKASTSEEISLEL